MNRANQHELICKNARDSFACSRAPALQRSSVRTPPWPFQRPGLMALERQDLHAGAWELDEQPLSRSTGGVLRSHWKDRTIFPIL